MEEDDHRLDVGQTGDESYEQELEAAVADLVARIRRGEAPMPAGEPPPPEAPLEESPPEPDEALSEASPETN